jgi:predicted permease
MLALGFLDRFQKDVRFGLRSFLRTPALSCLALLSLALGIGATTAIFSAVYSAIFDPFPYGDARHLLCVEVHQAGGGQDRIGYTADQFLDMAAEATVFSALSGSRWREVALTGQGEPERLDGVYATANIFRGLAVRPLLGRGFAARDARPGAPAVAVLSYKCWQRLFGGDPSVLGKDVRISDQVRTVIGVMPERVYWLDADVYMPATFERGRDDGPFVLVTGRLKGGVSTAEAETNLNSVFKEMARREPAQFPDRWRAKLVPFPEAFPSKIENELWMLLSAVGLLLTIACANVSSLLLSKASVRQKEMAIRASLGAGRGRIMRQLLTESLMLAVAGCGLGLLFAWQGLHFMLSIVPQYTIPGEAKIGLNVPVLLFSLAVAAVVAILTGLAPALHASREQLATGLRENGRGAGGSRKQAAIREGLVVAEVALSLVLLVAATLMLRTLFALQHVPLGIRVDNVLRMDIPLSNTRYKSAAERVQVLERYLEAIRQTRGVVAASLNTNPHPFDNLHASVEMAGKTERDARDAIVHETDGQYFQVLGIPLLTGRAWTEAEMRGMRRLAIVNQSFAQRYLSGRPAVGGSLRIPTLKAMIGEQPFEIIGVVGDVLNQGLTKTTAPEVYLPYTLAGLSQRLVIRTEREPMASARDIARSIRQVDAQQLVTEVMSMESELSLRLLSLSRFQTILFGLFASIGLALAIAGIYGVVSNAVERRTPELGVRLALGAQSHQVIGLVLGSGLRLVLVGIAVGLAGALALTRFLANLLFGIPSADPLSFGAVALILSSVGLAACLWPACRAARIDPIRSLRQE